MIQTSGLRSFARMVETMRAKQTTYFKTRDSHDLAASRQAEREVDHRIDEILSGGSLFDGADRHAEEMALSIHETATETVRDLHRAGVILLPDKVAELLDRCHDLNQARNGGAA